MVSTAPIERLRASAYRIPAEEPESDGTLEWDATTLVLCEVEAGGRTGIGYSYAAAAVALLIEDELAGTLRGADAPALRARWRDMVAKLRNHGRPGLTVCAVAACDAALHDLLGRLLDAPTATILGRRRDDIPVYRSGGFTSYGPERPREQLSGWASEGLPAVKIKIGREPAADLDRVRTARDAIGPDVALFVDANGVYSRKQALARAHEMAELGVVWFEEPVSFDDLEGLRLLRDQGPPGMAITAGEYGYDAV